MKVSAIIIAKNEEDLIGDALESLEWVDEIVLIDSESNDRTVEIAKKYGAKVFEAEGGSFSDWRNLGAKRASGEWLFYVDGDERVTPLLRKEIQSVLESKQGAIGSFSAYAIPRQNIILGKHLKHGGWWPNYVKRLFSNDKFKGWTGELHEEPHFEGELGHLKNHLVHLRLDDLSEMVDKTNNWSEIEARLMYRAGHPPMNVMRFVTAMFREFWLRMVRNVAFLDGSTGVIFALYQVYSRFISYAKLWEMQLKPKQSNN